MKLATFKHMKKRENSALKFVIQYINNQQKQIDISTMFSDYPLTLHDQIHDLAFSRALSLITCSKH